jgi:hypothetical protein
VTRFLPAISVSAALVLAAPFIGQLRAFVLSTFPDQYRLIIGGTIATAVTAAIVTALIRIRARRALRYGCLVAALALGTSYALISATGDATVDIVERFHFVEYGFIALLFYRAWFPAGDGSVLILAVLSAMLVGIGEEWLQWFIPARVGEFRDVVLNFWAIGCGLLVGIALDPPISFSLRLPRHSWRRVKRMAAVAILVLGLFLQSVHVGFHIDHPRIGSFKSMYRGQELRRLAQERAERWRTNPPLTWTRLSREDQYFTEGIMHVRRRNQCWHDKDFFCAWRENLILEEYFAPVLDTPSYISKDLHRWPPEQRGHIEQTEGVSTAAYVSEADDPPIWTWPRAAFWSVVGVLVVLLWL